MTSLELRDVGGVGRDGTQRVTGISFATDGGSVVGVLGLPGSGTATVAQLCAGRLPLREGAISIGETVIEARRPARRPLTMVRGDAALAALRRQVQVLGPGAAWSLNPARTGAASVSEALAIQRLHPGVRQRTARVGELLERVGLPAARAARRPDDLRPEERVRVALARSLATEPAVLVADELLNGVDVTAQAGLLNLVRELPVGVVYCTADVAAARYVCDRIGVLEQGRLVELDETDVLFTRPTHPHTAALIAAVPTPQLTRP